MTLILTPERPRIIHEFTSQGAIALAMQQAEEVRRGRTGVPGKRRQRCSVVIQVSRTNDPAGVWWHWADFWVGYWTPQEQGGIPEPTRADLQACAAEARHELDPRIRFARSRFISVI